MPWCASHRSRSSSAFQSGIRDPGMRKRPWVLRCHPISLWVSETGSGRKTTAPWWRTARGRSVFDCSRARMPTAGSEAAGAAHLVDLVLELVVRHVGLHELRELPARDVLRKEVLAVL